MNLLAKTRYTLIISIIIVFITGFDAYFAFVYHETIPPAIAASILETNRGEATGMLKDAAVPAIIVAVFTTFLYFMSLRELKKSIIPKWFSILFVVIFLLVVIPLSINSRIKKDNGKQNFTNTAGTISYIQSYITVRIPLTLSSWSTLLVYYQEKKKMEEYDRAVRVLPQGVSYSPNDSIPEKIFVIIGESSKRSHYSLYGYNIKTTPFLDSLNNIPDSNLTYVMGLSAACITREAVPIALSFATPVDQSLFITQMNVIDLAKKAGYETVWISGQDNIRINENSVGLLSNSADIKEFVNGYSVNDLKMTSLIEKYIRPQAKQCFFIHTNGSHETYIARYDSQDAMAIKGDDLVTKYDRTVHHTDRVIQKVDSISMREGNSLLYYFSDHAEIIGKAHGMKYGGIEQYEVPIFTIDNSPYIDSGSILKRYTNKETSILNTSSSIYILAEFMGYKVSEDIVNKAIDDGKYVYHTDGKVHTPEEVEAMKR